MREYGEGQLGEGRKLSHESDFYIANLKKLKNERRLAAMWKGTLLGVPQGSARKRVEAKGACCDAGVEKGTKRSFNGAGGWIRSEKSWADPAGGNKGLTRRLLQAVRPS